MLHPVQQARARALRSSSPASGSAPGPLAPRSGRRFGRRSGRRLARRLLLAAGTIAGTALALLIPGCGTDNPACIFGPGTCFGGVVGGLGANPAVLPSSGQVIRTGAPQVLSISPTGTNAATDTPVVIVFNESIAASTITGKFSITNALTQLPVPTSSELLGDGQVLVLLPIRNDAMVPALTVGTTYQVRFNTGGSPLTDLTGQAFEGNQVQSTFTVAANPTAPRIVTTFPRAGEARASVTTEFVVFFDRPIDPTSVTASNLFVTVDGLPIAIPPTPFEPLTIELPFGAGSTQDTRVYSHREVDVAGEPVPLKDPGDAGQVDWTISTSGAPIRDLAMASLPATVVEFTLSDLFAPAGAMIVSSPNNAIGIRNLVDPMGGTGDLAIDVSLVQGLSDDVIIAYLFGRTRTTPPTLAAVSRMIILPIDVNAATFDAEILDLALSLAPIQGIFADGDLAIAFAQRRGTDVSPLFVLDVDPDTLGIQDPVFDTTRPTLVGFGSAGTGTSVFRSAYRDLILVGRASEQLRSVSVSVDVGGMIFDNGVNTPVVGAATGSPSLFIAAPVELPGTGALDPAGGPYPMTVQLLDRALNASALSVTADFSQVGSNEPGLALTGPTFTVEVLNSRTLAPVVGARVVTHQDDSGTVTPLTSLPAPVTGTDGVVEVPAAVVGETIVTIDATNFDLFTLHGVTLDRLSILLEPSAQSVTITQSTLTAEVTGTNFSALNRRGTDSRTAVEGDILVPLSSCLSSSGVSTCAGAAIIRNGIIGAGTILGASFPSSVGTYSAQSFLRAFEFVAPTPAREALMSDAVIFDLDALLDDPSVSDEELGIDWLPHPKFNPITATGIDLNMLDGGLEVCIQANVPGVPGSATVGLGLAFDDMMGTFDIRAAYAGAVDPIQNDMNDAIGRLIESGSIEPILRLRVELAEATTIVPLPGVQDSLLTAKRAGARPRLDQMLNTIFPLGVPTVSAPLPLSSPGSEGFEIIFAGVIDQAFVGIGKRGLYRVQVLTPSGRKWLLWRLDQNTPTGGTVRVHAPLLSTVGATPLPDGPLGLQVSAFAWEGFDFQQFFWTDVEREYDVFGHTAISTFNEL